jgi:hypothetical protein
MVDVKRKVRVVDFSNVRDRGPFNSKHVEEGDYRVRITDVVEDEHDGDPRYTYVLTLVEDQKAAYPYRCKLIENQLWKLRNLFLAVGKQVPKKTLKVDFSQLIGMECGASLSDDEYEGKLRSQIDAVFPAEELADDPPPAKKRAAKKTSKKAEPEPEEEDEDVDEEEDEDEDLDLDSL